MNRACGDGRVDALLMAVSTLPLSIAVTHAGLQSGVAPWLIVLSSMIVFSGALQLVTYQIAATGGAGALLWITALLLPLRLLLYSMVLGRHLSQWSLPRRVAALYFLTDISFVEFQRSLRVAPHEALSRYAWTSRALWASWQIGTLAGLLLDKTPWQLPKEGVAVLEFACLALLQRRRT